MQLKSLFLLLAVFALILGGCKDDENPAGPAGPTITSYVGVMAGTGVSGTLTISIPTAKRVYTPSADPGDTVEITATLKINGGATIPLTGHHIVATGANPPRGRRVHVRRHRHRRWDHRHVHVRRAAAASSTATRGTR